MTNTKLLDIFLPYQKEFFLNNKKRKIWISGRQLGKSFTIAGILCYKALSKKNGLSLCISTGARAAAEIIRKCAQFAEAIKVLTNGAIDYTQSFDSIKFSNGCRVLSLPSSTDGANLRGFSAQCVCVDESAYISHLDTILQAINPTLTRDKESELILTTTPAGKNGYFYKLYEDAKYNAEWYVQHTSIFDAIKAGLKVDINALKSLCPDDEIFQQEYCCKFMSEYGGLIDIDVLDWYEDEDINGTTYFGMDVGSKNDRSAIVVCKQVKDITYLDDIIVLNKVSYENQLQICKQLNDKYKFKFGYVDETGIGNALAEFISKQVNSQIKGLSFTAANKTPMYEYLRSQIFQHKLFINKKFQSIIEQDFQNVQRIVTENGQVKFNAGRDQNGHSDITSALVLCLNAIRQNPATFSNPQPGIYPSRLNSWHSRL